MPSLCLILMFFLPPPFVAQTSRATATYKLKWIIPNELVDNVRGVER